MKISSPACLHSANSCGNRPSLARRSAQHRFHRRTGCYSSGVEHSLGKGEAESSNLSSSTIQSHDIEQRSRCGALHGAQISICVSACRTQGPMPWHALPAAANHASPILCRWLAILGHHLVAPAALREIEILVGGVRLAPGSKPGGQWTAPRLADILNCAPDGARISSAEGKGASPRSSQTRHSRPVPS